MYGHYPPPLDWICLLLDCRQRRDFPGRQQQAAADMLQRMVTFGRLHIPPDAALSQIAARLFP